MFYLEGRTRRAWLLWLIDFWILLLFVFFSLSGGDA